VRGDIVDCAAIASAAEDLDYFKRHEGCGWTAPELAWREIRRIIDDVDPSSIYIVDDRISLNGSEYDMERNMVHSIIEYVGRGVVIEMPQS